MNLSNILSRSTEILMVIYALLLIFGARLLYKMYMTRKQLVGEKTAFKKQYNSLTTISSIILIGLGIVDLYRTRTILPVAYIIIGLFFYIISKDKLIIAENGIYFSGRLDLWDNIKQWKFDETRRNLTLSISVNGKAINRVIPIQPLDYESMTQLIRKYKSKKKSKSSSSNS